MMGTKTLVLPDKPFDNKLQAVGADTNEGVVMAVALSLHKIDGNFLAIAWTQDENGQWTALQGKQIFPEGETLEIFVEELVQIGDFAIEESSIDRNIAFAIRQAMCKAKNLLIAG